MEQVIATPYMGNKILDQYSETSEYTCDQAMGEAAGQAMIHAKEDGVNIFDPAFKIVLTFSSIV